MRIRASADQAGWTIREAAWGFEERVLWRGSDATRGALDRAARATEPLQRLIQTRLTWPLSDAYRTRGRKTRATIAATAATAAIAAGGAGAIIAAESPSTEPAPLAPAPVAVAPQASNTLVLQGVTPKFEPAPQAEAPPAPAPKPAAKPAQVAWEFAQAFVAYEVGQSSKATESVLASTAAKPLVRALKADPPRLPANGKVPQARVLNVVLGSGTKQQVTASVSLVRLRALSELRLTLTRTDGEWRVAQVLG